MIVVAQPGRCPCRCRTAGRSRSRPGRAWSGRRRARSRSGRRPGRPPARPRRAGPPSGAFSSDALRGCPCRFIHCRRPPCNPADAALQRQGIASPPASDPAPQTLRPQTLMASPPEPLHGATPHRSPADPCPEPPRSPRPALPPYVMDAAFMQFQPAAARLGFLMGVAAARVVALLLVPVRSRPTPVTSVPPPTAPGSLVHTAWLPHSCSSSDMNEATM